MIVTCQSFNLFVVLICAYIPYKSRLAFYDKCNQSALHCSSSWTNVTVRGGSTRCLYIKCQKLCVLVFQLKHRKKLFNQVTLKTDNYTKIFAGDIFQTLPNVTRLKVKWIDPEDVVSVTYKAINCMNGKRSNNCKINCLKNNDQRNSCYDSNGIDICRKESLSRKFIVTAVIGSLLFSLIVVILLGFIRKYHPSRRENRNNHVNHSEIMEQTHFMAFEPFQPPPSYEEIGTNSLPIDDSIQVPENSEEIVSEESNVGNLNEDNYATAFAEESQIVRRKSLDSDNLQQDIKFEEDNRSNLNEELVDISDMLPIL